MALLLFIALVVFLVWFVSKSSGNKNERPTVDIQLMQRNEEWTTFIAGYAAIAKTKKEKQLLMRMLEDVKRQGLVPAVSVQQHIRNIQTESSTRSYEQSSPPEQNATDTADLVKEQVETNVLKPKTVVSAVEVGAAKSMTEQALTAKLDSVSLLLYFGAFLFIASAGLFVSFASVDGSLRTLVVFIVSLTFYMIGIWLYENKNSLKPAGLAFAGIGMSIMPLVGVAAYNFVFQSSASAVWFGTSIACLLLYLHSLIVIKKPLINYIFIFTLLSLFQSGVAIIDAPIYYFGWVMALFSIMLQLISLKKNIWPDFREAAGAASQLFLPIAVFGSLVAVGNQGLMQFGISLLIASCYYALQTVMSESDEDRNNNAVVTHISILAGVGVLSYVFFNDLANAAIVLLLLAVMQTIVLCLQKKATSLLHNAASIVLVSSLISLGMMVSDKKALLVGLIATIVIGVAIWLRQRRDDAYLLSGIGWIALPIYYAQVFNPGTSVNTQVVLIFAGTLLHLLGYFAIAKSKQRQFIDTARALFVLQMIVAVVAAFFAAAIVSVIVISTLSLLMLTLLYLDDEQYWVLLSGVIMASTVLRCWNDSTMLSIALFISLAYNILLALRFRSEASRWLSTVLWLLIPLGLGGATTVNRWTSDQYAWWYIVVLIGLLISRAIARGVLFTSSKIPLAAYAKNASESYMFGYVAAAFIAVGFSLTGDNSQLHTSLILTVLSGLIFIVAWYIEKQSEIIAVQPLLWQGILLSLFRPLKSETSTLVTYLVFSSVLAILVYSITRYLVHKDSKHVTYETQQIALITTFITPVSWLMVGQTLWIMPVGMFVASVVAYDYFRLRGQSYRESCVAIAVVSVLWLLYYFGLREIQAYTHIFALTFAGFAYWRFANDDRAQSDNYLYWMLGTATIPLILQALSSNSGGILGWWLLLEQVLFMIVGVSIKRKFVTLWGLYVAVGAVLYQLRDLGWAALSVLAVFIIGIAVYQLQKYNKPDDE